MGAILTLRFCSDLCSLLGRAYDQHGSCWNVTEEARIEYGRMGCSGQVEALLKAEKGCLALLPCSQGHVKSAGQEVPHSFCPWNNDHQQH